VRFVFVKHYYYFQNFSTKLFSYLLTYLFIQKITVVLEKLTSCQLAKKFPAFYGTLNFITALTSARQLSLYSARPIQCSPSHFIKGQLSITVPSRLGIPSSLCLSAFPPKILHAPLLSPYGLHVSSI
jgi:hypothetical protein